MARLIDMLGSLARDAILGELTGTMPQKYVGEKLHFLGVDHLARGKVGGAAHIQTTCPNGPDGLPDINKFIPPTMQFVVD